jgi:hypothetical protein
MRTSGFGQVLSLSSRVGDEPLGLALSLRPSVGHQLIAPPYGLGKDLLMKRARLVLSILVEFLGLVLGFADDAPGLRLDLQDLANQDLWAAGRLEHGILPRSGVANVKRADP